jgi:hypothetical protein
MLDKIEALQEKMDRVKVLMDVTGMSMEELMAESAMVHVDCMLCPIKTKCDQYRYDESIGCTEAWTRYLKGELDG